VASYVIRRLLSAVLTLFVIALITFLLMHAVPGGPFEARSGDGAISAGAISAAEAYYGLDRPLPEQFFAMVQNLLQGDLGVSFSQQGQPVTDILLARAWPSLLLGTMAFALVLLVGIPSGAIAAVRRGGWWDRATLLLTTLLAAVPSFVLAFVLLLVFAVGLGWVDVRLGRGFGDSLASLPRGVLPAIALAAPATAFITRLTRGAMLEVLDEDYIRTAHAKGVKPWTVYFRHAFQNALVPVVTVLGPTLASLVTGSIIIESIFGVPGIGSAFVTSVAQRDYGMIMGTTLFYAVVIVSLNAVVDLLYPALDPRIRHQ